MTKRGGSEKLELSKSDYIKLGALVLPIYFLLISVKADVATDKQQIKNVETIQAEMVRQYKLDCEKQSKFNRCLENAFAVEFGKNVYFYETQLTYRGDR